MNPPMRVSNSPYAIAVEEGKKYFWCACGLSANQPFCDGSHTGTGIAPVKYEAQDSKTVYFCGCKVSQKQPLCDGSHNLPVQAIDAMAATEPADDSRPKKTCSIDRLVTQPKLVASAKAGIKTQQRRDGVYGWVGEDFELDGVMFVVTSLTRQRLGDMTDADARAEGFPDLAMYKDIILRMHTGMTWEEDHLVWLHSFAIKA